MKMLTILGSPFERFSFMWIFDPEGLQSNPTFRTEYIIYVVIQTVFNLFYRKNKQTKAKGKKEKEKEKERVPTPSGDKQQKRGHAAQSSGRGEVKHVDST